MRIGIIGVNGIGQAHLWSLRASERSRAGAVCDIDAARAEKAASDYDVPAFSDLAAMFESGHDRRGRGRRRPRERTGRSRATRSTPDCTSTARSRSRRPRDEGYALARHAHEAQRTFQVGFQFRFHKGYAALRDAAATICAVDACEPERDELVSRAAVLRCEPVARVVGDGRRRSPDESGDPPTRRADLDRRPSGARARAGARHAASRGGRGRRDRDARMGVGRDGRARRVALGPGGIRTVGALRRPRRRRLEDGYDLHHHRARRRAGAVRRLPGRVPRADARVAHRRDRARAAPNGSTASSTRIATSRVRCSTVAIRWSTAKRERARRARECDLPVLGRGRVVELPLERGEYGPWYEELVAGSLTI